MDKFSEENYQNLSQKDVILHLLQVAQHTATREDVKEDILQIDNKINKVEANLNAKIDKVEANLNAKIDRIESKLDRLQWFLIAGIMALFLKDYFL